MPSVNSTHTIGISNVDNNVDNNVNTSENSTYQEHQEKNPKSTAIAYTNPNPNPNLNSISVDANVIVNSGSKSNNIIPNKKDNNYNGCVNAETNAESSLDKDNLNSEQIEEEKKKLINFTRLESKPENNRKICINLHWTRYDIITKVCKKAPFYMKISTVEPYGEEVEIDSDGNKTIEKVENKEFNDYDIVWFDSYFLPEKLSKLKNYQKINHFPGMYLLTRKNFLAKSLNKIRKIYKKEYNFYPKTYLLPTDMNELKVTMADYQKRNKKKFFIIKPEGGCQGKGINLIRHWNEIDFSEDNRWVCQKYMGKPYLIDGLKFDIRLYVLVTSIDPLRIWIHDDGFLRFCTSKYEEPTNSNMNNLMMHLTNYAINKTSKNFVSNNSDVYGGSGSKRHINWFKQWLDERNEDSAKLFKDIEEICVKTLLSVQPSLQHYYKSCQPNDLAGNMCFEILGFDILIDHKLKPYLIEVNHAPSFNTDSSLDLHIKKSVLEDTFGMLYMVGPRAKKIYRKNKNIEIQRRMYSNAKVTKEEKMEIASKELKKKDKYMDKHSKGYRKIYPIEQQPEVQQEYDLIKESVLNLWNRAICKNPRAEDKNKKTEVKPPTTISKIKSTPTITTTEEKKPVEIKSINDRLYYSRLTKNKNLLQESYKQTVAVENQYGPEEYKTSIVDLNNNQDLMGSCNQNTQFTGYPQPQYYTQQTHHINNNSSNNNNNNNGLNINCQGIFNPNNNTNFNQTPTQTQSQSQSQSHPSHSNHLNQFNQFNSNNPNNNYPGNTVLNNRMSMNMNTMNNMNSVNGRSTPTYNKENTLQNYQHQESSNILHTYGNTFKKPNPVSCRNSTEPDYTTYSLNNNPVSQSTQFQPQSQFNNIPMPSQSRNQVIINNFKKEEVIVNSNYNYSYAKRGFQTKPREMKVSKSTNFKRNGSRDAHFNNNQMNNNNLNSDFDNMISTKLIGTKNPIREQSNDNLKHYLSKEEKMRNNPVNNNNHNNNANIPVLLKERESGSIMRTGNRKVVSYDRNDRPPRQELHPNSNSQVNNLNLGIGGTGIEIGLCVNGTSQAQPKKKIGYNVFDNMYKNYYNK